MTRNAYTRLARPASLGMVRTGLWIGEGHLLLVEHLTGSERYRRIFLEDIQAVLCWPSKRRLFLRVLIGIIAALGYALAGGISSAWDWSLLALVPFALLAVWNEYRGPSVKVTLVTAVQRVELSCVRRDADWARLRAALEPLVAPTGDAPTPPPEAPAAGGETPAAQAA